MLVEMAHRSDLMSTWPIKMVRLAMLNTGDIWKMCFSWRVNGLKKVGGWAGLTLHVSSSTPLRESYLKKRTESSPPLSTLTKNREEWIGAEHFRCPLHAELTMSMHTQHPRLSFAFWGRIERKKEKKRTGFYLSLIIPSGPEVMNLDTNKCGSFALSVIACYNSSTAFRKIILASRHYGSAQGCQWGSECIYFRR